MGRFSQHKVSCPHCAKLVRCIDRHQYHCTALVPPSTISVPALQQPRCRKFNFSNVNKLFPSDINTINTSLPTIANHSFPTTLAKRTAALPTSLDSPEQIKNVGVSNNLNYFVNDCSNFDDTTSHSSAHSQNNNSYSTSILPFGDDTTQSSRNNNKNHDTTNHVDPSSDLFYQEPLHISINNHIYQREISPGFVSIYRIYDILSQARVPFYLHDQLIETIGQEIVQNGFQPFEPELKRKAFVKELCRKFKTPEPTFHPIHLESHRNDCNHNSSRCLRDTVEVVCFDFVEQLRDILSDVELFGNLDNLVINKTDNLDDRWLPYKNNSGNVYEVLDGYWYQQLVLPSITDPLKEFAIPIGLYIDASETVTYQRYSFQPLIMFPLILNVKARNKPRSSRVIALIPDLEAKSSAVKRASKGKQKKKGMAIRNYHKCMEVALASFKAAQQAGGVLAYVRIGNEIRYRMCRIPLAFVLGDAKSQDTLCGRYGGHKCARMCRACYVSFDESDLVDDSKTCTYVSADDFKEDVYCYLSTETSEGQKRTAFQNLHQCSQHAVINAFTDMDFAGNPRGIFGSTPHDLMHLFLEGILKYCSSIYCDFFTTSEKADIDLFVDEVFGKHRSSEKRNMLRTNFTKGLTNLTMVTADEQAGIALTLLILSQMDKGRILLTRSLPTTDSLVDNNFSSDEEDGSQAARESQTTQKCCYNDFLQLLEILLSFHAWYKSTKPIRWDSDSKHILNKSIQSMLQQIKSVLPRKDGNGWKIQKFHEHLHISDDVHMFGSPKNFDCGIWENRLIYVGKQHASSIQKRGPKTFTRQLGNRIHVRQCSDKCRQYLSIFHDYTNDHVDIDKQDIDSVGSDVSVDMTKPNVKSTADYSVMPQGSSYKYKWNCKTISYLCPLLLRFIRRNVIKDTTSLVNIWCEFRVNGLIYRAHPNYRGGGQWFDWCMISYELTDVDVAREQKDITLGATSAYPPGFYPAKLLGFFLDKDDWKCIIHTCKEKADSREDSCLTERWYLEYRNIEILDSSHMKQKMKEPILRIEPCAAIRDRVYVIEEFPGFFESIKREESDLVILVKKRQLWTPYFTDLIAK